MKLMFKALLLIAIPAFLVLAVQPASATQHHHRNRHHGRRGHAAAHHHATHHSAT